MTPATQFAILMTIITMNLEHRRYDGEHDVPKPEVVDSAPDLTEELELESPTEDFFSDHGLSLTSELTSMIKETKEHRYNKETGKNNRRGSGFFQATRYLADAIKRPRSLENDANILFKNPLSNKSFRDSLIARVGQIDKSSIDESSEVAFEMSYLEETLARLETAEVELHEAQQSGSRQQVDDLMDYEFEPLLDRVRSSISVILGKDSVSMSAIVDNEKIRSLREGVEQIDQEGERLLSELMVDILDPRDPESYEGTVLPAGESDKHTGTCTSAEQFFLEMAMGISRDTVDILTDTDGDPVMLYKRAGARSAITLKEVLLNGVRIPQGALMEVDTSKSLKGVHNVQEADGYRFLRLTSLAVSPEQREQAIGMAYSFQHENHMIGYDTVTIERLRRFAGRQLSSV